MAKNKITWLLLLQGWTMLWVIIGHAPLSEPSTGGIDFIMHNTAQVLFSFAYTFHMPLFIMISGYLFYLTRINKSWNYHDMIKEKWLRLGIPYIFFITVAIIVKICFSSGVYRTVDTSAIGLLHNYIEPFNGALKEMWFVAVIFIYFICYPIYPILLRKPVSTITVIALGTILYYIPVNKMSDIFAINRAIHLFVFFFIGLTIGRWRLEQIINNWRTIIICLIGYALCYSLSINIACSFFASIGFWGLAMKIDQSLTSNLFHSFRNYTYQIFLMGIFVQIFVKILSRTFIFPGSYPVWWMTCVLLGIYLPVWIARMHIFKSNKFLSRLIGL